VDRQAVASETVNPVVGPYAERGQVEQAARPWATGDGHSRVSMEQDVLLSAEHITKVFPGVRALDNVDFDLRRGEIHAILGENGAGKSTLIKVLGGVYAFLRRYGPWAVVLGWASLWLICRTLLFDLHAGTFVGIIGFYVLGLIMLRLQTFSKWSIGLAALLIPFHSFSGIVLGAGELGWGLIGWKKLALVIGIIICGMALTSAAMLNSSIAHVAGIGNSEKQIQIGANFFNLDFDRFVIEYAGMGVLVYWFLGFNVALNAWMRGWRPGVDQGMAVLAATVPPLLFMTFSPWAINGDRTGKLVVGVLMLLATAGIVAGLKHLGSRRLNWICAGVIAGCFGLAASQNIAYWLQSGSYR